MYGPVLGPSIVTGSVIALPETSGNTLSMFITLTALTIGVTITVVTAARILAAKFFSN